MLSLRQEYSHTSLLSDTINPEIYTGQNFAIFSSKLSNEENEYGITINTAQQPTAAIIEWLPYARLRGLNNRAVPRGLPTHLIRSRDVRVRFIESTYKNIPHIGDPREIT